jgi:integrase/recombinase XerD
MAYAISLKTVNDTAHPIRALWEEVARFESRPSMVALDYPPHLTLAVYDEIPPVQASNALRETYAAPPGTRMLLVRGKGDKQRLVLLHDRAIEAIAQWQKLPRAYSVGAPSPWLFHSVRNGSKALTRQAALQEIREAAVAAGLASSERVSPHVLRHAFATHMHSGGTDLRVLQELLGHAGIEITQIYTHLDTSRLHQMVRDLHPLNEESTSAA